MEIGGSAVRFAKRILRLEAHGDQLKEAKIKLKEQVIEAEDKDEEMVEKCGKVKEDFDSEKILLEEKLKAAKAEAEGLKILLEETLERQNKRFEMDFSAKMAMEADKQKVEEKNLELIRKIEVLEERNGKMEAENCKLKEDKRNDAEKICNLSKAFEVEKKRLEKARWKKNELVKWIGVLDRDREAEKMSMEEEGKKKVSKLTHRIEVLKREKREIVTNFHMVKREKLVEIKRILNEKVAVEAEKAKMKAESKKKVLELVRRVEGLEKENREIEPIAWSEEIERILKVVASRSVGGSDDPEKNLKVVETEAEAIINFLEEKLLALTQKIQVVEGEKAQLEAEFRKLKEDNRSEAERIRKLNKALETEKKRGDTATEKIRELVERVKEAQKKEMEAKVCQAKQQKSEEIHRISNEKRDVKQDCEKKILELVNRNDLLEREKRGFEAEIAERDEVIKLLAQEKCCLEDKKKELEMEIIWLASNSMEDVQLSHHAHLADNVVTLSTPRPNEGQYSAGVAHSSELNGSINLDAESGDGQYEDELTHTNACKRKRSISKWEELGKKILKSACESLSTDGRSTGVDVVDVKPMLLPCQKNTEMNTTRCEWEVEQDVLDALDVYPELCLKAVCALYRQHQRLGHSTNTLSSEGIAYAVYLMSEDPEGRKTKKMVAKLDGLDRDAVGKCMNIAKQHYKQVFEIYKKKEDPVFLS